MSTPIANNTEQLQEILNAVSNLPNAGGSGGSGEEPKTCIVNVILDFSSTNPAKYIGDVDLIQYSDIDGIYHIATEAVKFDTDWNVTTNFFAVRGMYTLECLCGSLLIWDSFHFIVWDAWKIERDDAFTQLLHNPPVFIFRVPSEPGEYSIKFTPIMK